MEGDILRDPNYLGDRNFMVVRNCLMSGCHLDIEYQKSPSQESCRVVGKAPESQFKIFSKYCKLYSTDSVLHCTVLYCTILYYSVLYFIVLYCTVLYCTVLYYTLLLYCTILYCTCQVP